MTRTLLIGLAASVPLGLVTWLAAWAVEALGASLKLRLRAWTTALVLPAALAPAMLAIHAAGVRSPFAEPWRAPALAAASPAGPVAAVDLVQDAPVPSPAPPFGLILLGVAGCGAAFRLAGLALALRRVARIAAASEAISDPALAGRLGAGVRQADTAAPILAGLMRPVILMPRRLIAGLSAEQAALVCAHERAHLAAGDHLSHLMEETLVRLYWFNPMMAATRERLAAAREEACDARALAGCDDGRRRAYAQTLLAALRLAGPAEPVAAFTGFRRRGARRRLDAILRPAGPSSWRALAVAALAALGLTAALGGLSLAFAAEPPPPPPPPAVADPAPPSPPAPPGPPARPVPPAPPAIPAHHHAIFLMREDGGATGHAGAHAMVLDGDAMHGMDPDHMPGLTPQQREKLKQDMARAHAAMAQAMADSHEIMEQVHKQMGDAHMLGAEEQARIHRQVEDAMQKAHAAMADNDGRVLMRCKLGPDGKATDCQKLFEGPGEVMMFAHPVGPHGEPMPMPPMPPPGPSPPPPPG